MTADPKPPADLTCPEPTYGHTSGQNKCGRPVKRQTLPTQYSGDVATGTTPVWYCGMHANMHDRRRAAAERREHKRLQREQERADRAKRAAIANNLAAFLSEQLATQFTAAADGRHLLLSIEDARRIYDGQARLTFPPGGSW